VAEERRLHESVGQRDGIADPISTLWAKIPSKNSFISQQRLVILRQRRICTIFSRDGSLHHPSSDSYLRTQSMNEPLTIRCRENGPLVLAGAVQNRGSSRDRVYHPRVKKRLRYADAERQKTTVCDGSTSKLASRNDLAPAKADWHLTDS